MLTNNRPNFDADSVAMLDRLRLIPFNNRFTKDESFDDKVMITYKQYIFSYLVDGAYEWYQSGKLQITTAMKSAMDEWVKDVDIVHEFITSECEKGTSLRIKVKDCYDAFTNYLISSGQREKILKKSDFLSKMRKTYTELKSNGEHYFTGLSLISSNTMESDVHNQSGSKVFVLPEM